MRPSERPRRRSLASKGEMTQRFLVTIGALLFASMSGTPFAQAPPAMRLERVIPMHGAQVQPYAELEKIVTEWSGKRTTTTTFAPGP